MKSSKTVICNRRVVEAILGQPKTVLCSLLLGTLENENGWNHEDDVENTQSGKGAIWIDLRDREVVVREVLPDQVPGGLREGGLLVQLVAELPEEPELKGSIGEGPNHSNFSDQSSVKIQKLMLKNSKKPGIMINTF